jgi:hypothetical protein
LPAAAALPQGAKATIGEQEKGEHDKERGIGDGHQLGLPQNDVRIAWLK